MKCRNHGISHKYDSYHMQQSSLYFLSTIPAFYATSSDAIQDKKYNCSEDSLTSTIIMKAFKNMIVVMFLAVLCGSN